MKKDNSVEKKVFPTNVTTITIQADTIKSKQKPYTLKDYFKMNHRPKYKTQNSNIYSTGKM